VSEFKLDVSLRDVPFPQACGDYHPEPVATDEAIAILNEEADAWGLPRLGAIACSVSCLHDEEAKALLNQLLELTTAVANRCGAAER
jgi:hypothetical protein